MQSARPWTRGGEAAAHHRVTSRPGEIFHLSPPPSICGTAGRANQDLQHPNPRRKSTVGPQIKKKKIRDFDVFKFFFGFFFDFPFWF